MLIEGAPAGRELSPRQLQRAEWRRRAHHVFFLFVCSVCFISSYLYIILFFVFVFVFLRVERNTDRQIERGKEGKRKRECGPSISIAFECPNS